MISVSKEASVRSLGIELASLVRTLAGKRAANDALCLVNPAQKYHDYRFDNLLVYMTYRIPIGREGLDCQQRSIFTCGVPDHITTV